VKIPSYLLASFALLTLIAGCKTYDYAIPTNVSEMGSQSDNALVILSTGADKPSISAAQNLLFVSVETGNIVVGLPIDNSFLESHFEDHMGFVHAVSLPEGKYQVRLEVLNIYLPTSHPDVLPKFEVKAGEMVYLGELYLTHNIKHYEIRNEQARDIAMIRKMNPDLDTAAVETRLIEKR